MLEIFRPRQKRAIDECARSLAQQFSEGYGAQEQRSPGDAKKSERRLARALDGVHERAREFHGEHSLGVYGKARLGNTFKWELREMGYDHDFIEEVTKSLILRLSR